MAVVQGGHTARSLGALLRLCISRLPTPTIQVATGGPDIPTQLAEYCAKGGRPAKDAEDLRMEEIARQMRAMGGVIDITIGAGGQVAVDFPGLAAAQGGGATQAMPNLLNLPPGLIPEGYVALPPMGPPPDWAAGDGDEAGPAQQCCIS